jgi:hypothetical protein
MTFTTLTYNGVEKPLADWLISNPRRDLTNQAQDRFACDVMLAADAVDPFPYGSQVILRLGRQSTVQPCTTPAGLPLSGLTSFTGGTTWFIGWRVDNFRTGSPNLEKLAYKFAGPWEFFFERLVFQKLWWTWNGAQNVADWRSQIILGMSANALVGVNDTVPGTSATNLMSIAQQVREIVAYVMTQSQMAYGAPQIQLDGISAGGDGIYRPNWDTSGNYLLYTNPTPENTTLVIPDFIAGAYATAAPAQATSVNTLLTTTAPGTIALANTVLRAPLDSVNDITCAEAMRKMLRWIGAMGDPVLWFDYTGTLNGNPCPTLHISTRDLLPAVSLPFPSLPSLPSVASSALTGPNGPFYATASKIKRRDDLIPAAVELKFRLTGTWNGFQYTQVIRDVAGAISGTVYEGIGLSGALYTLASFAGNSPTLLGRATMTALQQLGQGFAAQSATIDMQGNSSQILYCTIATIAVNTADPALGGGASLPFWTAVFPELNDLTAPVFVPNGVVSVVDDQGNPVNTSTFQYLLTDGQIAPWMLAGNAAGGTPVQCQQCTITAAFQATENNDSFPVSGSPRPVPVAHVQNHQKHARVTLVTIPGGTYSQQSVTLGEIVPYGLAGYIYNIAHIPQYEGAYTIQETEITDQVPLGNNLNLTGSLAEWATMAACVQQISYDLTAGRTSLTFGPAAHLGAKDFVERLRVNRGPRWFNLNGNNVTNSPGAANTGQLGNHVAQRGPSPGPRAADLQIFPISLADLAANGSSYTYGSPGATVDTRGTGQPNYGNISGLSAPNAPTIMLAQGSGGALSSALVRITPADLAGHGPAWFQEVGICVNVNGTPTPMNIMVLCTAQF